MDVEFYWRVAHEDLDCATVKGSACQSVNPTKLEMLSHLCFFGTAASLSSPRRLPLAFFEFAIVFLVLFSKDKT